MADFTQQPQRARNDPLGPVTLNQLHTNVERVDELVRREHLTSGKHNATEIPWVLGHINAGTTGYLFDTAYGGAAISRPTIGETIYDVASGVIPTTTDLTGAVVPQACVLANVSDADIANRPYLVHAQMVSATQVRTRTRRFTGTLGTPSNSWDSGASNAGQDVAIYARKQTPPASVLLARLEHVRRDFLTEQATDWNALVQNQGLTRALLMAEHDSAGNHNANRIAKACSWFRFSGGAYSTLLPHGISSVTRISTGVIEVEVGGTFSSTNHAACFAQAQVVSTDDLVIINGRATSTKTFRFYVYSYSVSENKWARDDRSFYASMFWG